MKTIYLIVYPQDVHNGMPSNSRLEGLVVVPAARAFTRLSRALSYLSEQSNTLPRGSQVLPVDLDEVDIPAPPPPD